MQLQMMHLYDTYYERVDRKCFSLISATPLLKLGVAAHRQIQQPHCK
jgi:hypothetical protein